MPSSPTSSRGSLWNRWDLHFHTPSSFDYEHKGATTTELVEALCREGIRAVAVTDHHVMDVARIREMQTLGAGRLTVFPGIELRAELGSKPINYICIFPEDIDLDHLWTRFAGTLKLTPEGIAAAGGDDKVYVPMRDGATLTRELGGIVTVHAGGKSNSIDGIGNQEQFQQRIKFDVAREWVDAFEVGQLKDVDRYLDIVFPSTGLSHPLFICSDNHDIRVYPSDRRRQGEPQRRIPSLWLRSDPTFRGLLMVLHEPRDRVYIGAIPPEVQRVDQNKTKYIRSISFTRRPGAPADQHWFDGVVEFSSGLVAIVGNKGSGKSALADTIGLLGASRNASAFSFLTGKRFRHPTSGLAAHFDATMSWESQETTTKCLADSTSAEEVERVRYLPQDHVETVCNELASSGPTAFEKELKSVIFSHVPDDERLGNASLDALVQFQTGEKQKRIDALLKQLREGSRTRAALEKQADPSQERELKERITRRDLELTSHDSARPADVVNPATVGGAAPDKAVLDQLAILEKTRSDINVNIETALAEVKALQRRRAVAGRLLEKLVNFRKEVDAFRPTLEDDARELALDPGDLVAVTVSTDSIVAVQAAADRRLSELQLQVDAESPPGLRQQVKDLDRQISDLRATLDAPNRAYQAYIEALALWEQQRLSLLGSAAEPESLNGLNAALAARALIPSAIVAQRDLQLSLAREIHGEKVAQVAVYRTLYHSVQAFISSHPLAKDKLRLEFRAELLPADFPDTFLRLLSLGRRGSFMGVDAGKARADELLATVVWDSPESVVAFLQLVDDALHQDLRDERRLPVQLCDQLAKSRTAEDVFNFLYGLDYVHPRYILKWDGKDLSMLSPGERGTLLLVFYLLIDRSDIPLLIDQPEGNLDNHTVATVLVECIKQARARRQVFIVTHNPNLAVVCDADQVVHASISKTDGNRITYATGSLESPDMSQFATDVLEGTRRSFDTRGNKYDAAQGERATPTGRLTG